MKCSFSTIGHSNRAPETIIGMLKDAGVQLLVDVRAFPKSRSNPAFNEDPFAAMLADHQIGYRHMRALGGRRAKQPDIDERLNGYWKVHGFHNYADYALKAPFQEAFGDLLKIGGARPLAIMCAEAVWWRCHRRIITDYLLLHGHEVRHLMTPGRVEMARPTEAACLRGDGTVIYPA